uniref:Putative secreted protein n=1 Tax=Ixodes ricinus TaxID=34613 RepID=A0A147BM36_IXORI
MQAQTNLAYSKQITLWFLCFVMKQHIVLGGYGRPTRIYIGFFCFLKTYRLNVACRSRCQAQATTPTIQY